MTNQINARIEAAQDAPAVIAAREAMDRARMAFGGADVAWQEAARKRTAAQSALDAAEKAFWDEVAAAQPEDALFVVLVEHVGLGGVGLLGGLNQANLRVREACIYTEQEAVTKAQEMQAYSDRMARQNDKDATQYRAMSVSAARVHIARDTARATSNTKDLDAGLLAHAAR